MRIRHDRLARNALFLQTLFTETFLITEPLGADGLESYVCNQFYPINLNILIGADSQFVYSFTESHSKRKGTTTVEQKLRMQREYQGKSFAESRLTPMFARLLHVLINRCEAKTVTMRIDEHPVYAKVIARWNHTRRGAPTIIHEWTSSKRPRTMTNPLFAVNYFDRLIRKDIPNHRRETVCQARNDRNLLARFAYYVVTHNYFKPYRISSQAKQREGTHAQVAFAQRSDAPLWLSRFHEKRFMASFVTLPWYFRKVWYRRTPTPLRTTADPVPRFAFY